MLSSSKWNLMGIVAVLAFWPLVAMANAAPAGQNQYGRDSGQAAAKPSEDSGGPAPVHDLNGTWRAVTNEPLLNNRIPPMTPEGQAKLKLNVPDPFSPTSNDPWQICDPLGMPRIVNNEIGEIGFSTMPGRVIILENFAKVWREVWTDGRALPENFQGTDSNGSIIGHKGGPSTKVFGYSVGHWEGDNTLVVDTVGMDAKTWVDRRGYPHSIDAHVTERYTRIDHNHMNFEESMADPAYYAAPFVIAKGSYRWIAGQDNLNVPIPFAAEYMCFPSKAIEYMKLVGNPADEDAATGVKK